jgi:hypothetical protein
VKLINIWLFAALASVGWKAGNAAIVETDISNNNKVDFILDGVLVILDLGLYLNNIYGSIEA